MLLEKIKLVEHVAKGQLISNWPFAEQVQALISRLSGASAPFREPAINRWQNEERQ